MLEFLPYLASAAVGAVVWHFIGPPIAALKTDVANLKVQVGAATPAAPVVATAAVPAAAAPASPTVTTLATAIAEMQTTLAKLAAPPVKAA